MNLRLQIVPGSRAIRKLRTWHSRPDTPPVAFAGAVFLDILPQEYSAGRPHSIPHRNAYSCQKFQAYRQAYTDLNSLCYNSFSGQGQLLWVGACLQHCFGRRFSLVSMVSINLGIQFYGVEMGDAGESIEPEESQ